MLRNYFSDTNVDRGLNNLKWFDWGNLVSILKDNLYSAFTSNKEALKPIGETMAQILFEGIQSAFDTDPDLRPTITPVLKLDEVKQQLIDFFGTGTIEGFNLQAIASEAMKLGNNNEETTTNYTDKFDEVTAAINTLKDSQVSVNDLGSDFSQMKIVTDTGELIAVLTPGIDEAIGRRIWLIQNNIVP